VVLEELDARVTEGLQQDQPVPFYRTIDDQFVRELL